MKNKVCIDCAPNLQYNKQIRKKNRLHPWLVGKIHYMRSKGKEKKWSASTINLLYYKLKMHLFGNFIYVKKSWW